MAESDGAIVAGGAVVSAAGVAAAGLGAGVADGLQAIARQANNDTSVGRRFGMSEGSAGLRPPHIPNWY